MSIIGEKLLEPVTVPVRRRQNARAAVKPKSVFQVVVGITLFYVRLKRPPLPIIYRSYRDEVVRDREKMQ